VRERNWNAPRPKWDPNASPHHGQSVSPLVSSLSPRPSISHVHSHSHSRGIRAGSPRLESPIHHLTAGKPTLRPSSSHSSLNTKIKPSPRVPSPSPHSATSNGKQPAVGHRPTNHASRPSSPLPPTGDADPHPKENGSASKPPASSSRFGWQFPRNKNPLPPLEFDQHSPERILDPAHLRTLSSPSPTPGSKLATEASGSVKASHIPVRSPHVSERNVGSFSGLKKGHKRSTTELSESRGGTPPRLKLKPMPLTEDNAHQDSVLGIYYFFRLRLINSC
jgi:serine/arginine repetitive matrix protein 2